VVEPVEEASPSYDETIREYHRKRMKREEERKRKAEERKAREEERKRKRRELVAKRAELKHALHQVLEGLRRETEYRKRHEGELVERIRSLRKRINVGLPAEERKPARLRLEGLKDQLSELQMGSFATILKLKSEKAVLRAKLDELKGKATPPREPGELCPVLVAMDDRSRYTYALRVLPTATTEEVLAVLKEALPSTVRYIITDNGPQFTADDFREFCEGGRDILHVRIYPHHPNENGRVERHIRSVKDVLELYDWGNEEELGIVLIKVEEELNATPHQGIGYMTPAAFQTRGVICQA
jgi:transposase InsO family protein